MSAGKIAVIINPASANGTTARRWPKIVSLMEKEGFDPAVHIATGPGDAIQRTRQALEDGYGLVVSVGGDGTAHEVVNGFFSVEGPVREKAAAGFISMGTGGDLARTLGLPKEPAEAVRHLLHSARRRVDVGCVSYRSLGGDPETRYFINIAGLGLDGDTVARVNRTGKALGGFLSFLWGTVASALFYRNQPMTISVDGKRICDAPVTVVAIGNGQYFGGGMRIAPRAEMADGLFDIIILHGMNKARLLANLPKVYRGAHLTHPNVFSARGRRVEVQTSGTALLELDGELIGRAPAEIVLLPLALRIQG